MVSDRFNPTTGENSQRGTKTLTPQPKAVAEMVVVGLEDTPVPLTMVSLPTEPLAAPKLPVSLKNPSRYMRR